MRDLRRALEDLSEDLARTRAEISILEQTIRQVATTINRVERTRQDPLRRQWLGSIFERVAIARARQSSIARLMEECGRERRRRRVYAEQSAESSFDALIRSANCEAG